MAFQIFSSWEGSKPIISSQIVSSWGGNRDKPIISPVISSTPSIVSIESIQTSSAVREAPCVPESEHVNSVLNEPSGSETALTSASAYPRAADAADASFVRHHKYFFKDGNVTFLVDGTLYCVHRYFFSRDSVYFSTRFAQLGVHDHEALPIIISLGNIERNDFEAFLSVLYPEDFEQHKLSYEEWSSVLNLSTQWNFASIRRLALNNIQPPTPHDQLLLARTYSVDHWVIPALSALCERSAPLSLDEARRMDIKDVVLVATVREDIRNHTLKVDAAEIPRHVEAAQAGKPVHIDSVDVPSAVPSNVAVERPSSPGAEKQDPKDYNANGVGGESRPGTSEDTGERTEPVQLVEDRGGEAVLSCEAGSEGVRSTGGEAPKDPVEEEAVRRKSYEEEVTRAENEENARRNAYAKARMHTEVIENARRKAYTKEMDRTKAEENARRNAHAEAVIHSDGRGTVKRSLAQSSRKSILARDRGRSGNALLFRWEGFSEQGGVIGKHN